MPTPLAARHAALVIAGPTAVGKTGVAIEVARSCGGEIVGADAFQIYAGLDVLTAKPTPEQRSRAPHHAIGEVALAQSFDVARYLALAGRHLAAIRARGRVPVIVGGTGLYVRALLRGLADLPSADLALRAELEAQPLPDLQARLQVLDPTAAAAIDLQNPRRVVRALEICLLTGRPFSSFRDEWTASPGSAGVVLVRPRDSLHRRIEERVEAMFADGVVEEVRDAGEIGPTAGQALGLSLIRAHLAGQINRADCVAAVTLATRQYAKRQLTWFRRETGLRAVPLTDGENAEAIAERIVASAGPPTGLPASAPASRDRESAILCPETP